MARTETEIIAAMGTLPAELTEAPNSEMAGWRKIAAKVVRMIEQLIDMHSADINTRLAQKQYGTEPWYKDIALVYQHGDSIVISDKGIPHYAVVDADKQIIAQCAIASEQGIVRIKVAQMINEVLNPLSELQLSGFSQYMQMRMPIGLSIIVLSAEADRVQLVANVVVDSQFLLTDIERSLKEGLKAYQTGFNFNGEISISDFYNVFNSVKGAAYTEIETLGWYAPDFNVAFAPITRVKTYAGYFNYTELSIRLRNSNNEVLRTIGDL